MATNPWRVARWSLAGSLLITPALAMQFTDEVNWTAGDFLTMGVMLLGANVGYEFLTSRASGNLPYRVAAALAVGAAFLLVWVNLAVGIIGTETNPANLMFAGVLAIGVGSSLAARFESGGMSRGMLATAAAQAVVGLIGVGAGLGGDEASWPYDITGVTAIFCILWLIAAWLFTRAARQGLRVFA